MKYWLESLAESGFDVFTVVYMAGLFTLYHYLMRWYQDIRFKKIEDKIDVLNQTMNEALDEVLD
tara:strand:- start:396 stop:587 length:192 start_codon:yes stop_codon:yes gene_type:complete